MTATPRSEPITISKKNNTFSVSYASNNKTDNANATVDRLPPRTDLDMHVQREEATYDAMMRRYHAENATFETTNTSAFTHLHIVKSFFNEAHRQHRAALRRQMKLSSRPLSPRARRFQSVELWKCASRFLDEHFAVVPVLPQDIEGSASAPETNGAAPPPRTMIVVELESYSTTMAHLRRLNLMAI